MTAESKRAGRVWSTVRSNLETDNQDRGSAWPASSATAVASRRAWCLFPARCTAAAREAATLRQHLRTDPTAERKVVPTVAKAARDPSRAATSVAELLQTDSPGRCTDNSALGPTATLPRRVRPSDKVIAACRRDDRAWRFAAGAAPVVRAEGEIRAELNTGPRVAGSRSGGFCSVHRASNENRRPARFPLDTADFERLRPVGGNAFSGI